MDEASNKNNTGSGNVKNNNGSGNVKNNNSRGNVKNNNGSGNVNVKNNNSRGNVKNNNGSGNVNVKNNNGSGNVKNNNGSGNVKNNNGSGNVKNNDCLETSKADKLMWLMKCPSVVSQSLQLPPPPSDQSLDFSFPVAKIIESIDPLRYNKDGDDSSTEFTLEFAGTESGNVPKSYSMNMSKDFIPMAAFSESSEGRISVEGKIVKTFDMRPHQDNIEDYAKHWAERTKKSKKKTRQIKVIDDDNGTNKTSLPGPGETSSTSIASSPNDKNKSPVKVTETKRRGSDPGDMKDLMFKLFERQSNWTYEQLNRETQILLRAAIKDLCVHNKKGSYELKPEYKKSVEE